MPIRDPLPETARATQHKINTLEVDLQQYKDRFAIESTRPHTKDEVAELGWVNPEFYPDDLVPVGRIVTALTPSGAYTHYYKVAGPVAVYAGIEGYAGWWRCQLIMGPGEEESKVVSCVDFYGYGSWFNLESLSSGVALTYTFRYPPELKSYNPDVCYPPSIYYCGRRVVND